MDSDSRASTSLTHSPASSGHLMTPLPAPKPFWKRLFNSSSKPKRQPSTISEDKAKDTGRPEFWPRLKRAATFHFTPHRPIANSPGTKRSLLAIAKASWLNVLLIFIPVSWAVHFTIADKSPIAGFVTCFFAIIPLAKLMGFATEELALRVGQTLGGLLNATLGNAVELIISIFALIKCELRIVQTSLVGSILSNLLLVLGMCFFAGGIKFSEQGFGASASQLSSSLLVVSVIALLLPAAFHSAVESANTDNSAPDVSAADEGSDILKFSRGVAIILLITYGAYLFFQLYSHAHLYDDNFTGNFQSTKYPEKKKSKETMASVGHPKEKADLTTATTTATAPSTTLSRSSAASTAPASPNGDAHADEHANSDDQANTSASATNGDLEKKGELKSEDAEEEPQLDVWICIGLLIAVTVLVAVTADFLVDSITPLTEHSHISQEWVGLILLPIVGNAAEHVTAVTVSVKDKLTLSLGVAAGSSIQIALFVIPFMVILAWIIGKPLTLLFDPFESITLFLAVITVNYVVADGKTNWLEGVILMNLYIIIATTFWFYGGSDPSGVLNTCH
ncbi:calcium/proton exchanger [Sistotremastrum suecicum HHB10207 ss-3]|uniref:Calcium/proton exchanger n=1 Tax=Sistotremastrum suecicum HHB10207 ss-3 TaxID=1314776 RepID=A0A166G2T4_9AGAM|nr:calcium/proton exchanger [Sistotremastrum suecicum HHB10207 ss-3]